MKRQLIERLNEGPVICAEGFLFEVEKRGYLAAGEFVPMVALEHPEALENLHKDFQHAGSDVVEAFTYNGHREKMRVIGKEELLEPLNRAALKIAKKVADNPIDGGEPNLMAGNISNSNIWAEDDKDAQKKFIKCLVKWLIGLSMKAQTCLLGKLFIMLKKHMLH
jgi:betaine-homocysteine S-methyltransferase